MPQSGLLSFCYHAAYDDATKTKVANNPDAAMNSFQLSDEAKDAINDGDADALGQLIADQIKTEVSGPAEY